MNVQRWRRRWEVDLEFLFAEGCENRLASGHVSTPKLQRYRVMINPKNDLRARVESTSAKSTESSAEVNNTHCTSTHVP